MNNNQANDAEDAFRREQFVAGVEQVIPTSRITGRPADEWLRASVRSGRADRATLNEPGAGVAFSDDDWMPAALQSAYLPATSVAGGLIDLTGMRADLSLHVPR